MIRRLTLRAATEENVEIPTGDLTSSFASATVIQLWLHCLHIEEGQYDSSRSSVLLKQSERSMHSSASLGPQWLRLGYQSHRLVASVQKSLLLRMEVPYTTLRASNAR